MAGLDFDGILNEGKLSPDWEAWLRRIDTYFELSPSGNGIRGLVKADITETIKLKHVEIYKPALGRYLTITGSHVSGMPTKLKEAGAGFFDFYDYYRKIKHGGYQRSSDRRFRR